MKNYQSRMKCLQNQMPADRQKQAKTRIGIINY